jgi:polysaccharide deacetylase family protein (PEP-CTERM system associated)
MVNVLSVDVEEYFHPSEVQASVSRSQWSRLPARVESSTKLLLDLLAAHEVQATFFVLGWVAQRYPRLVRDIAAQGHEIACHSFEHQLVYNLTPDRFRSDTIAATTAIEDACGQTPKAYRAPSYSVTERSLWALEILAECGYTHDSSIYPVVHDRYGIPGFSRFAQPIQTPSGTIIEVPPSAVRLSASRVAPVGGGGYLRLLPYRYTAAGIRRINSADQQPACIYVHPWEFDPEQPRLASGAISRLRTYTGLRGMKSKLQRLLSDFRFSPLRTVCPSAVIEPSFKECVAASQKAMAFTANAAD